MAVNAPAEREGARVLVVDDEPNIVDVISMALRYQGFEVESRGRPARDALAAVTQVPAPPDRPRRDAARHGGLRGRARGSAPQRAGVPIIFLTARDATEDKIRGLTIGGDDYVTKPFSLEELVARIRDASCAARAWRAPSRAASPSRTSSSTRTRSEVTRAGEHVELTATEYRLLRYLMLNPRRVLTRAQLLDHVWDYDFGGDARVLETYISYLRKKLDAHGPPLIHTVRGVGYALRLPRE